MFFCGTVLAVLAWPQLSLLPSCRNLPTIESGRPRCYGGQLLMETFSLKLLNYDGSTGVVDMKAEGPQAGQCDGAAFQNQDASTQTLTARVPRFLVFCSVAFGSGKRLVTHPHFEPSAAKPQTAASVLHASFAGGEA